MEDGQGSQDEDIVVHISLPQAVPDCEESSPSFEVYRCSNQDTAKGVQSGYGSVADGSSSGSIAARMGNGSCSFIRSEGQDLPHGGCGSG